MIMLLLGCASASGPLAGGPEADAEAPNQSTVSYARDIQPIWDTYCMKCHGLYTPHLDAPSSRKNLDGASFEACKGGDHAPFVVPGEPDQSFLYYKLTGESREPIATPLCASPMPATSNGVDAKPLREIDPAAVERIRQWILEGAADN